MSDRSKHKKEDVLFYYKYDKIVVLILTVKMISLEAIYIITNEIKLKAVFGETLLLKVIACVK